jgi:hypothetical protein
MEIVGGLRSVGRATSVLDTANFETFEALYPEDVRSDTYEWALRQPSIMRSGLFTNRIATDFALPSRLRKRQNAAFERIGEQLVARSQPVAVFFKVESSKDIRPTLLALARVRAMRPRTRIFGFGRAFSDDHALGRVLRNFDAVVLGSTFLPGPLCDAVTRRDWADIPNLAYYDGPQLVLTRRERPSSDAASARVLERSLYTASPAYSKIRVFDFFVGRTGAGAGSMVAPDTREYSEAVGAIRSAVDAFGSKALCIRTGSRGDDSPLERALLSSDLRITYATSIDPAETPRTRLGLLSASGCVAIDIPVFSGSQLLLDRHYRKQFTVTQVERLARTARFSGLFTSMHFEFPCVDDDYHTEDETVRLIGRANPNSAMISPPCAAAAARPGPLALEFGPIRRRARVRALKQCASLCGKVHELNVPTGVDAATALIASLAGFRGRESAFVEHVGLQLLSGDTTGLAETIEQINDGARKPARSFSFKPIALRQNAAAN